MNEFLAFVFIIILSLFIISSSLQLIYSIKISFSIHFPFSNKKLYIQNTTLLFIVLGSLLGIFSIIIFAEYSIYFLSISQNFISRIFIITYLFKTFIYKKSINEYVSFGNITYADKVNLYDTNHKDDFINIKYQYSKIRFNLIKLSYYSLIFLYLLLNFTCYYFLKSRCLYIYSAFVTYSPLIDTCFDHINPNNIFYSWIIKLIFDFTCFFFFITNTYLIIKYKISSDPLKIQTEVFWSCLSLFIYIIIEYVFFIFVPEDFMYLRSKSILLSCLLYIIVVNIEISYSLDKEDITNLVKDINFIITNQYSFLRTKVLFFLFRDYLRRRSEVEMTYLDSWYFINLINKKELNNCLSLNNKNQIVDLVYKEIYQNVHPDQNIYNNDSNDINELIKHAKEILNQKKYLDYDNLDEDYSLKDSLEFNNSQNLNERIIKNELIFNFGTITIQNRFIIPDDIYELLTNGRNDYKYLIVNRVFINLEDYFEKFLYPRYLEYIFSDEFKNELQSIMSNIQIFKQVLSYRKPINFYCLSCLID